ncbi:hypothetical protein QBC39DRAFT_428831 [Podospora conica]|nr:hypothetical protein QBC39DRAFT_428831 [Schizothecium conicum]
MAPNTTTPPSPTLSQLPAMPASPTYSYASTAANPLSQFNLPPPPPPQPAHAFLTKADIEHSQTAYADLLSSAKSYRLALAALSTAASTFGSALEACARLKEARADTVLPSPSNKPQGGGGGGDPPFSMTSSFHVAPSTCTADALLTVAGLQHLIANHQHILSETVYRSFEVPLLHELDKWRGAVDDEEEGYERAVAAQSKEIRRLERDGLKLHRQQRRRDVAAFRSHLVQLTTKLDGLTTLHGEHARTLLRESQETSVRIVDASCSLVRAEVDIFESLARKGWTGGGLDDVLEKGVDLFANDDPVSVGRGITGESHGAGAAADGSGGSKLFSILPPKSILADSGDGGAAHNNNNSNRTESLLLAGLDRYQSLASAISEPGRTNSAPAGPGRDRDRDADSVFSEFNRSRGVRPFSPQPQPLRLNPEALLDGLERDELDAPLLGTHREEEEQEELQQRREKEDEAIVESSAIEEEDDDEEAHPWRNEGRRDDSDEEEGDGNKTIREDGSWGLADGV